MKENKKEYGQIVAENIRYIRVVNNLTQKEFAKILGYSARTISDWEHHNTEPNMETIKRIKTTFNINYEDIFE